jgi:hypothetical protein
MAGWLSVRAMGDTDTPGAGTKSGPVLEGTMAEPDWPTEKHQNRKISLPQQIEEIDQELHRRKNDYPRLVSRGKLRESEAEYQTERLLAVRMTLEWLQEHEDYVRWAIANRQAIKQKMQEPGR